MSGAIEFHMRVHPDSPTVVRLVAPGPIGGFDVRGCPHNLALARLLGAAPALLSLVERYASECAECGGRGTFRSHREDPGGHSTLECWECADIREAIAAAQVKP